MTDLKIPQPKYKLDDVLYWGYRTGVYTKCSSCGRNDFKEPVVTYDYKEYKDKVSAISIEIHSGGVLIDYSFEGGGMMSEEELFLTQEEAINDLKERDKNNG